MVSRCLCVVELRLSDGRRLWWFGGGSDLTPIVVDDDDAKHFHTVLKVRVVLVVVPSVVCARC